MTGCTASFLARPMRVDCVSRGRLAWCLCRRPLVVVLLAALANVCAARIQADDEDDELVAVVPFRQVVPAGQVVLTEQQFDRMVFGGQQALRAVRVVNGVQRVEMVAQPSNEAEFRKQMEAIVAAEIQAVDRGVLLTEAQKKKLQLAGRGDVLQFLNRVADLRRKLTSKPLDRPQYVEFIKQLGSIRQPSGFEITAEYSLFWKTLRGTLTDEQRVRFKTLERERRKQIVEVALLNCEQNDNNRFLLTGETRQKMIDLILDHGHIPQVAGSYDQFIVLLEADLLRERIKPLLTEAEWHKFEWHLTRAKQMVPLLERSGQWPARRTSEDDETTADAKKD